MSLETMLPGTLIRQQRVARGMSLREAAAKLGLTHVQMGEVERNMRYLTSDQVAVWTDYRPKDMAPAREVAPGPFTLLDLDAAPVGGWWPEDVGERSGVRVEGPLHPRVGTVVRNLADARGWGRGTVVEQRGMSWVVLTLHPRGWCFYRNSIGPASYCDDEGIIGATILYVPMGEP